MTKEEMAKAYADGYNKEYQQIAYDAFLCGYGAKCESFVSKGLEEAAEKYAERLTTEPYLQVVHKTDFIAGSECMKAQMMKEAVAVEVVGEKRDLRLIDSTQRCLFNANRGDWLKIIIVKEDEK